MRSNLKVLITLFVIPTLSFGQEENNIPITPDSKPFKNEVYFVVDQQPEFPGGEEALKKFYREKSKYSIAEGENGQTIYYQIVINEKGKVKEYQIIRGQSEELKSATEKLIKKMPKWKPGIKDKKPVRVVKLLSITYTQ